MTDLWKHGVIIVRYFSLYGLELDLWSSVLALPRHQADACPNRSALHGPKKLICLAFYWVEGEWIFYALWRMFCLQAPGADLVISRSILLTWSSTEPHKGVACHTLMGFQFAFVSVEAARVFLARPGVCMRKAWLRFFFFSFGFAH